MNDDSENEILSTPERKRIYIQRWLENNPCVPEANAEDRTPHGSPRNTEKTKNEFLSPRSPSLNFKTAPGLQPISPVFGKKRASSSPIIEDHRQKKRSKVVRNLNPKVNLFPSSESSRVQAEPQKDGLDISSEQDISSISKTIDILDSDSSPEVSSGQPFKSATENHTAKDVEKKFSSKISQASEQVKSQLIESVSSNDESPQKMNIHVVESPSDTDRTLSDLIEEMHTQSLSQGSEIPASPQISNAPSESSQLANNVNESEKATSSNYRNNQFMRTVSSIDIIDSIGTSESKADVTKTCCIIPYNVEKSKKRKNPKKGSLLESLTLALAKERSNVNLLRHELRKNKNDYSEKPFLLLQVVGNQLTINDNQFIKCLLVEDSMDLLTNLFTNRTNRFVTVINVPDVSGTINLDYKPLLKVYEPWSVLDPNQVLISITRFTAVPSAGKYWEQIKKDEGSENFHSIKEFNCPCVDEKAISVNCKSKFCDGSTSVIEIVFNDRT